MESSLSLGRLELNSSPTALLGVNLSPRLSSGPPPAAVEKKKGPSQGASHLSGCVPLSHQVAGHKYGVDTVDLYLKLEDVTRRFNKPCIMDVKLGQRSYDPFASQEKREQQIKKYPLMEEIGFLVLGMRVYKVCSDSFETYNQHYGRGLVKDTIKEGLSKFFHNGEGLRLDAVSASVSRVRRILGWFQSQRQLAFYASSLLFVYEGHPSSSSSSSPLAAPGTELLEDRDVRDTGGLTRGGGGDEGRPDTGALKEMSEYNNNNIQGWTMGYSLTRQYDNQRKGVPHYRHAAKGPLRDGTAPAKPAAHRTAADPPAVEHQPNGNGVILIQGDAEHRGATNGDKTERGGGGGGRRDAGLAEGKKGEEVEVRMIDFAHVFPSDIQDHGYIYGLKRLLAVLEEIQEDASSDPSLSP
ncbi:hypothetical protein NHX12_024565 [Muraenolepis orangiensis]|uniref:Kinase n=1 Tax=Muraenolepis orangiensis TaxID=630683 RepID=A0A9Q0EIL0_9TELE|nr:hypothetical protein NHX12_024565 [Muraenolepis orangiensis]